MKKLWQSPDRNWYLILGVCGGYVLGHIIIGVIIKIATL